MTDDVLDISGSAAAAAPTKAPAIYDADAKNRFVFEKEQNGQKFDIGHIWEPLDDERYMQWNRDLKVKGNADEISEESREATVALFDDQVSALDNVEIPEGADWKSLVDSQDKIDSANAFLAVAIVESEEKAEGKFQLGQSGDTQPVITEAWFNNEPVQQTHVIEKRSLEREKQYERIQKKQLKTEQTRGLRRQPKIEYVPQDEKLGELYDEMQRSVTGFANDKVPLRFKTTVMNYIFRSELKVKSLGK